MPTVYDPATGRFRWVEFPATFNEAAILQGAPRDPVVMQMASGAATSDGFSLLPGQDFNQPTSVPATRFYPTPDGRPIGSPSRPVPTAGRIGRPTVTQADLPGLRREAEQRGLLGNALSERNRSFSSGTTSSSGGSSSSSSPASSGGSSSRSSAASSTQRAAAPASNITRSSDGRVSYRNGRRIDSNGNYAFTTSRSPQAAAAPVAPALGAPMPQPGGATGFGMDPFVSGQVPLPPGQFYPADIYAGNGGAYGGMPWMQQAQGNMYGAQFYGPGAGAFPGPGNNMYYWPNLTDPQVQRNLAVINAQFPWVELQESTRRDNRNFFEQARNNLFNRRASAYGVASRASLPNVREIG